MTPKNPVTYTDDEILHKLEHYCAYQERCHDDIYKKLEKLHVPRYTWKAWINRLEDTDFLDQQRFAISYARGHFYQREWGKIKIRLKLQEKRVPILVIIQALETIEEDDYIRALEKRAILKWTSLPKDLDVQTKLEKTYKYLEQRGFETSLIWIQLHKLKKKYA